MASTTSKSGNPVLSTHLVKPSLTVTSSEAAITKRPTAKKRRPRPVVDAKKAKVKPAASGVSVQETPAAQAPAPLLLRPFTPEDVAVVSRLTQEQIAPIFRASYGYDLEMNSVMPYIFNSQTRMVLLGEQVIGYLSVVVDDNGLMNVGSLVLDGPYQGQGFGTRIMRQVEQEARSMGLSDLEVFIQATNERSQGFAKSLGFVQVPSNQPQTIVMRKSLRG